MPADSEFRGSRRELFFYRIGWPSARRRQGEHRATVTGEAGTYRGNVLLREAAELRRLALRASLHDPFERLWVREHRHTAVLDLWVLTDLSGSMCVAGEGEPGCRTASRLVAAAAHSCRGPGDRLGVFAAADEPMPTYSLPLTRHLPAQLQIAGRIGGLAGQPADRASADGLFAAHARLGAARALVFLVSDFQADRTDWSRLLKGLSRHQVVPVVCWQLPSLAMMRARGLVSVLDAETGEQRLLWMRKALRDRIGTQLDSRYDTLQTFFAARGLSAVHFYDGFDPSTMTAYFRGATARVERPSKRFA